MSQVLTTPDEYTVTLQVSLASHVIHYRCLFDGAQQLVNEMAQLLAQTQGAFLTSIKGIGIVLAAGVTAEIGNPLVQRSADQLASYAGIVPKVKQSGGSQGAFDNRPRQQTEQPYSQRLRRTIGIPYWPLWSQRFA